MGTTYQLTDHRSLTRLTITLLATLSLLGTQLVAFTGVSHAGADEVGAELAELDLAAIDCDAEPDHEDCVEEEPADVDCAADPAHEDCVEGPPGGDDPAAVDCEADPAHEDCVEGPPGGDDPAAVDCDVTPDDPSCALAEIDEDADALEGSVTSLEIEPLGSDDCATGGQNPGDSLDQWANGKPGTDPSDGKWQNGNLNANNSQYKEGDSVGFRRILTGLQENCRYQVFINYDTVNNGLVAYDYLTSWDRTDTVAVANPLEGVSGVTGGLETVAIDGKLYERITNAGVALAGLREFSAYGATWEDGGGAFFHSYSDGPNATGWPAKTETDRSSNATITTTVRVEFTAASSTVVLAWGGHIAMKSEWAPKLTAPRETDGSPYHMRNTQNIQKLIDDGVAQSWNAGNQDRSLKAGAVLLPNLDFQKSIKEQLPTTDVTIGEEEVAVPTIEPGDSVTYQLIVSNFEGESDATVTITDNIPAGLVLDQNDVPSGCELVGTALTCTDIFVAVDTQVTIEFPVTADGSECELITNSATMTTPDEPITDSARVYVYCNTDVEVDKEAQVEVDDDSEGADEGDTIWVEASDPLEPGEAFRYQISVTSTGNITAPNVTTVDDLSEVLAIADLDSGLDDIVFTYGDGTEEPEDWDPQCAFGEDDNSEVLTCTLGDLPVDHHITIHIPMTVNTDLTTDQCGPDNTYTNTVDAKIDGDTSDTDTAEIELACYADVEVDKEAQVEVDVVSPDDVGDATLWVKASDPLEPGEAFRYQITVTSTGNITAPNVTTVDDLSEVLAIADLDSDVGDIAFIYGDGDAPQDWDPQCAFGEDENSEVLTCTLGDLPVDDHITIHIPMTVNTDLTADQCDTTDGYENTVDAKIDGVTTDTDTATIHLTCDADVSIDKSVQVPDDDEEAEDDWRDLGDEETLAPGDAFRYLLTVTQSGNIAAADVTVTDTDLADLLDVFDEDGDITIDDDPEDTRACTLDATDGLDCDLKDLAVDEVVTITIPMTVTTDLTADQCGPDNTYTNTAEAYLDGELADDDDAEIELACDTDVNFDKQLAEGSPSSLPLAGGSTIYELTAENDGDARATGVVIRDTVPDVFEIDTEAFDTANAGIECDIDGSEVVCGPVSIAAGGSVTVEIPVSLTSGLPRSVCGVVTNAGEVYEGLTDLTEVDFAELDPDHTDSVDVNIVCPPITPDTPQITLDKTADPTSIVLPEGEDATAVVSYTYTALNSGDVTLSNVTLTDDVLGDLTDELREALGKSSMSVGESVTFSVDQTVGVADVGLLVNIATVSGTRGGTTVTDTGTASVEITQVLGQVFEPSIEIVKEALIEADEDGLKTVTVPEDGTAEITYRYTITNTGDTTLIGITLDDDVIGDLTGLLAVTTLEPDESTVVEVTYTTTAADRTAGGVDNVGITTGTSPQGVTVEADDDESVGIVEVLDEVEERPVAKPLPAVESLPRSGADTNWLIGLGLVLSALGSATLLLGSRRRRGHPL